MKKNHLFFIIIFSLVWLFPDGLKSQDNTLFFMPKLHQSMKTNPSYQPHSRSYFNIPGLSCVQADISFNGFGYWDGIHYGTGTKKDSLVVDLQAMADLMTDVNYLNVSTDVAILGFGFKKADYFFSFGMNNRTDSYFGIPRDIVTSAMDGNLDYENDKIRNINFSGIGANVTNYFEFALGISKVVNSQLIVGGRLKYLKGVGNIQTERSELIIETDEDAKQTRILVDMLANASFPAETKYNEDGDFDGYNTDESFENPIDDFLLTKNNGFAIDLGATYALSEKATISAGLLDFGFIKWKSNTHTLKTKGEFPFEGIDLYPVIDDEDTRDIDDLFEELSDSISNEFEPVEGEGEYNTFTTAKINIGGWYQVHEKINLGALAKGYMYDHKLHPSLTLSANFTPSNWFMASISYSMMNRTYNNFGLGFALRGGPFQFYLISDNLSGLLKIEEMQTVNIRFGINLTFGNKPKVDVSSIDETEEAVP